MSDLTARGIEAYKHGNIAEAYQLFVQALRENANDELAWLWILGTIASDKDKIICLENALRINPNNQVTRQALARLQEKVKAEEQPSAPVAQAPVAEQASTSPSMQQASAPSVSEEAQTLTSTPQVAEEATQPSEPINTSAEEAPAPIEAAGTPALREETTVQQVEQEPESAEAAIAPPVEAEVTSAEEMTPTPVDEEVIAAEVVAAQPVEDATAPPTEKEAAALSEEAVPAVTQEQPAAPIVAEQPSPEPVGTQASGTDIYNAVTATVPATPATETVHNASTEMMPATPSPEVDTIATEVPQPEQATAPMQINRPEPAETEELPIQATMPSCPRCGLSDEVTKVNPRGAAGPPQAAAAKLTPPQKPAPNRSMGSGLSLLGILILILGALFAFGLAAFFILPPNFNYLYGILAIIIGAIPFLLIYYRLMTVRYSRIQRDYEARLMRWNEQMVRWNQLYYCARCDVVFNPDQGSSVAPYQMQTLLNA